MQPYKFENQQAVFTSQQINNYGLPEDNGWDYPYIVIEEEADSHPLTSSYESISNIRFKPVHRYCRISRFKIVLQQLMGDFGFSTKKSRDILSDVSFELPANISYTPPCLIWDTLWHVLKSNKISKYYNRIPAIIKRLNLAKYVKNNRTIFMKVMDDFKDLDRVFNTVKTKMKRNYFPSLRFIALKLLCRHGYSLPINIPFARTPAKVKRLEEDYDILWDKVGETESEFLDDFFGF